VLIHPNGRAEALTFDPLPPLGAGFVVGGDADPTWPVESGARLVLYTDGLIERRDAPLDDGVALVVEAATGTAHLEPKDLAAHLLQALTGDRAQPDDVVVFVVAFDAVSPPGPVRS
jgi:hypothetical protein